MQILEYIWIDGVGELKSKVRCWPSDESAPTWTIDGSSMSFPVINRNTEVVLNPVLEVPSPFQSSTKLVLCETLYNNVPTATNTRRLLQETITNKQLEDLWFGFEQEYIIYQQYQELGSRNYNHYCTLDANYKTREVVEEHMAHCIRAGLMYCGFNAEVTPNQWEYQIGPICNKAVDPLTMSDHLILSRYILLRVAQKHGYKISMYPKLYAEANGSGLHTNMSSSQLRAEDSEEKQQYISKVLERARDTHELLLANSGNGNEKRLTGRHETSDPRTFTSGIGTRDTSVRIQQYYIEDRRPAANADPYTIVLLSLYLFI